MTTVEGDRPERGRTWPVLLVFAAALLLRLGYLSVRWPKAPHWHVDAMGYHQLATNLIERRVFSLSSQPPFQPDALRTPAYPLFLALLYWGLAADPRAVLLAQAVLDACTALLVLATAMQLTRSRRVATLAGLLYALCPLAWRYSAELLSETLLAFAVMLAFYCYARALGAQGRPRAYAALGLGAACALCAFIRPSVVLLPVILAVGLIAVDRRGQAALLAGTVAILLMPWVVRNTLVFGHPMLSTVLRSNLARVSAPATLAEVRGEQVAPWTPRWEELYHEVAALAARTEPTLMATPAVAMTPRQLYQTQAALARAARRIVLTHPRAFVMSHLRGALRGLWPHEYHYWFVLISGRTWHSAMPDGIRSTLATGGPGAVPLLALFLLVLSVGLLAFGIAAMAVGAWRLYQPHAAFVLAAVAFIAYTVLLPGPIAYERFRVPVQPLVCLLMACAVPCAGHRSKEWHGSDRTLDPCPEPR